MHSDGTTSHGRTAKGGVARNELWTERKLILTGGHITFQTLEDYAYPQNRTFCSRYNPAVCYCTESAMHNAIAYREHVCATRAAEILATIKAIIRPISKTPLPLTRSAARFATVSATLACQLSPCSCVRDYARQFRRGMLKVCTLLSTSSFLFSVSLLLAASSLGTRSFRQPICSVSGAAYTDVLSELVGRNEHITQ